jgi:glycosyltransferase involved in cell wall biosynthesis
MKLSIITVCYNAAATIEDTLISIAAQDWTEVEHIIVDGASSDNTLEMVARYSSPVQRVISEPDKGLYDAMNKGIAAATGDVIGFLNADDFYCRTDALSLIVRAFAEAPCSAVSAAIAIVRPGSLNKPVRAYRADGFRSWMLRLGHMPPHPGFFVRREAFAQVGLFATQYSIGGDFDWMVRFFLKFHLPVQQLKETVVGLRQGGVSTAGIGSHARFNKEACYILRGHGFRAAESMIWMKYAFKCLQWVLPAFAYPPSDAISVLPALKC